LPATLSLSATYRRAARPWPPDQLANAYRAALRRGERSDPPLKPSEHPIGSLASTIPRLVRLAAAAHILHVLPERAAKRTADGALIVEQLLSTLDNSAAPALRLCHFALESADRSDSADDWVSYALEEAADALPRVSLTAHPPSLIDHAEEAARSVAVAVDAAYSDPPAAPRPIADSLAHLLVVCVFADLAYDRHQDPQPL
jgi:hypothetical protein